MSVRYTQASESKSVRVLLDFDGTVTRADTVDVLLERFALPQWRGVESEWESGRIGSRECLLRQTALLRATPAELDAEVDRIPIDPALATLVRHCRERSLELLIVSDGYERVIRRVLARAGLSVPFVSNVLVPRGRNRWALITPATQSTCRVGAAHCKCARAINPDPVVLIGDGRSDFCVAHAADFVIAKGALARYCAERHLNSVAVTDLNQAVDALDHWLTGLDLTPATLVAAGEIA
jgi:2-hydroxy-3-keto-5-methylthiopentenyl-1-phosphate phosphatase